MIQLSGLDVFYGTEQVLKNINLSIKKHEILALIGPSGCGKSTLLYAINRLLEERGGRALGSIMLDNTDILSADPQEVRQRIGMVFQSPCPFPFSVYKNLSLPLLYHNKQQGSRKTAHSSNGKPPKAAVDVRIRELLAQVGLLNEVDIHKNALLLSGGQQQRLCIARSLSAGTEFLLLDEPCSQLDVKNTQKIEELLLQLKQDIGIAIVTHNLAQAKRIADTAAFIFEGEVLEYAPAAKLFGNPQHAICRDYISGRVG
ncbi:MAG: ATP-binding cassette domain-containing protein [Treponema sp.]